MQPDGRGKWVYRKSNSSRHDLSEKVTDLTFLSGGYIVSGGVFVGRWRDCVTPDEYVGYEGELRYGSILLAKVLGAYCCIYVTPSTGTFTLSQRVDVVQ